MPSCYCKPMPAPRCIAHEYPREIEFLDELPMTTTGKIIRKALRELEEQRTAMELQA